MAGGLGQWGHALTVAGIVTVLLQTPAGWIVDRIVRKRLLLIAATLVLGTGALLLTVSTAPSIVYASQILIGGTGAVSWANAGGDHHGHCRCGGL